MTQLCYTLDEAAQALGLSETILVRLSQYFKIPAAAYDNVGYLSFKGDLVFMDADLQFFRQVKERLVTGESLEEVKQRIQSQIPLNTALNPTPINGPQAVSGNPASSIELNEIEDTTPYKKAAEQSFERYKHTHHRSGLSRVFENMMKEVGSGQKKTATPQAKPMRNKIETSSASQPTQPKDRLLPFSRSKQSAAKAATEQLSYSTPNRYATHPTWASSAQDLSWDRIVDDAKKRPRIWSQQLQSMALYLRQTAIKPPEH